MSNLKLTPCPFCGGVARLASEGETVVFVTCQTCHVETQGISVSAEYCANEKAAEAWNHRGYEPAKARWERSDFTHSDNGQVRTVRGGCAVCTFCRKAIFMPNDFDYCPNCGASMEKAK